MAERTISTPRLIRFGVYEVDLRAGELRKKGVKIKLEGQPLRILALLLERPGQLVTREELKQKLWPADTFVDFEHSINAAVLRLRQALDDSAGTPRFIETLPRHGYRFVCPVEDGAAELRQPAHWWRRRWVASLLLFALPALLLGLLAGNVGGLRDWLLGTSAGAPITSLAVLPLENLSGDPEQEYFADGMTEALITELGKISALRVISRQSVMQFKGTDKSLPEIARELNVDAIVEGAVVREGNRVRITAQLVQASPERHLWSETYERDLHSILAVQSEVARKIAREIKIGVTPEEEARLAGARPVNPEAYVAYLKGRYHLNTEGEEGFQKAREYLRQAIDIDPTYAPAYAGLANGYNSLAIYGQHPPKDAYPMAKAALVKALELDDTLPEAHTLLGVVKFRFEWDWRGAERELKRALQLDPNNWRAHLGYGAYLLARGRLEEGLVEIAKHRELNPFTPKPNLNLAWALRYNRRYDEAIDQVRKALDLAPDSAIAYVILGENYASKKMYTEAIAACEKALELLPKDQFVLSDCGWVFAVSGRPREALSALEKLRRRSANAYVDSFRVAYLAAALYPDPGQSHHALEWLERAYEQRSANLSFLKTEPRFPDRLRDDPRFQSLLRRMNFPE
jgi:TolB-like protein/tetratricopeptide (TPR) repeat protein/DNA-binding winged helix-turn-helix (wHTH) protein